MPFMRIVCIALDHTLNEAIKTRSEPPHLIVQIATTEQQCCNYHSSPSLPLQKGRVQTDITIPCAKALTVQTEITAGMASEISSMHSILHVTMRAPK